MLDWQNVLVAIILLLASFYLARRCWNRIRVLLNRAPASRAGCHSSKCDGCDTFAQESQAYELQRQRRRMKAGGQAYELQRQRRGI